MTVRINGKDIEEEKNEQRKPRNYSPNTGEFSDLAGIFVLILGALAMYGWWCLWM